MKERPILFSAPMVRAILDGTKTQTRRVLRRQPQPNGGAGLHPVAPYKCTDGRWNWVLEGTGMGVDEPFQCPYGAPGDRLWVREAFAVPPGSDSPDDVAYRADLTASQLADEAAARRVMKRSPAPWKPGIHMPRWASRITLEVAGVRVERLHAITEEDARAEGVERYDDDGVTYYGPLNRGHALATVAFERLWDEINGKPRPMLDDDGEPVLDDNERPIMIAPQSWASNPWVWVVEFRRLEAAERAA